MFMMGNNPQQQRPPIDPAAAELFKNYTHEQIENANKTIGKYKALKIKNGLNGLKKSMEDMGQQIKGAMEVFSDTTKTK